MPRQQWTALSFTAIKTGIIIFSFYILLFYVQGVKQHKLFFSQADTTAKNRKYIKFAYPDAVTSVLCKDNLPRVATRTLRLLESINSFS